MTTRQALLELKKLAKVAGEALYRRVELAEQCLSDLDWIAVEHGGSELKAQDTLQSQFFPDLDGYLSLGKLRAMYRDVPKSKWAEVKYGLAAVEVIYDEQTAEKTEKGTRTSWKKVAEDRADQIDNLQRQVTQVSDLSDKQRSEVETLREKVAELTRENERLQGRLEELQRLLDKQPAHV